MISTDFKIHLQQELIELSLLDSAIESVRKLTGGSVNQSYELTGSNTSFFLKVNDLTSYPNMFEKEVGGLNLLRRSSFIEVPEVLIQGSYEKLAFLVLEFVPNSDPNQGYWEFFGKGLATLHQNTSEQFGLSYNNYNGSLHQMNHYTDDWGSFFIENRLTEQQRQARDNGRLSKELSKMLDLLYPKLSSFFPEEKPALLHGDLWSGNFMVKQGNPCYMDPSVYYGHREVDLAMSLLFGGFDKRMYEAYHEIFPLEKDWEKRVDVFNLYPLMVHVNLFGTSYAQRVKSILKNYI